MPFSPGDYAVILKQKSTGAHLAYEVLRNVVDPQVLRDMARILYLRLVEGGDAPAAADVTPLARPVSKPAPPLPVETDPGPSRRDAPPAAPAGKVLERQVAPTTKPWQIPPSAVRASKRWGGCEVAMPAPDSPPDATTDLGWAENGLDCRGLLMARIRRDEVGGRPSLVIGLVVRDHQEAIKWLSGGCTRPVGPHEAVPGDLRRVVVRRQETAA